MTSEQSNLFRAANVGIMKLNPQNEFPRKQGTHLRRTDCLFLCFTSREHLPQRTHFLENYNCVNKVEVILDPLISVRCLFSKQPYNILPIKNTRNKDL